MTELQQKFFTIDSRMGIERMYENMLEIYGIIMGKLSIKPPSQSFSISFECQTTFPAVNNWHSHVLWFATNSTSKHF